MVVILMIVVVIISDVNDKSDSGDGRNDVHDRVDGSCHGDSTGANNIK